MGDHRKEVGTELLERMPLAHIAKDADQGTRPVRHDAERVFPADRRERHVPHAPRGIEPARADLASPSSLLRHR